MRIKVIVVVIVMLSLCTCISFSNDCSAQSFLRIFAAMYAPAEHTQQCSNSMTFGTEHIDLQLTTENITGDSLGQKIYK